MQTGKIPKNNYNNLHAIQEKAALLCLCWPCECVFTVVKFAMFELISLAIKHTLKCWLKCWSNMLQAVKIQMKTNWIMEILRQILVWSSVTAKLCFILFSLKPSPHKQYQDNAGTHRTSVYFRLRLYTKLVISWSNIYNIEIVVFTFESVHTCCWWLWTWSEGLLYCFSGSISLCLLRKCNTKNE